MRYKMIAKIDELVIASLCNPQVVVIGLRSNIARQEPNESALPPVSLLVPGWLQPAS